VERGEDIWKIARVAKNPWNLKERCGSIETEEGQVIGEDDHQGKCKAFLDHNFICGDPGETREKIDTRRTPPKQKTMEAVRRALGKTRSTSAPGPDGITWRLLKALKDTRLGTAVLEDVCQFAEVENRYYGEE